ncbi:MAG: hypothetical protein H7Y00_15955, partial [Fimbriimonadaceae bacterium]|nr:hypothetical protein [Chitinophagales bacterium]
MKKLFSTVFLMICCCVFSKYANAQCDAGEIKVSIQVTTDAYGYEGYWELVPAGNDCGEATIFEGGNVTEIGCTGAGDQDATTPYGYGDNLTITEGHWCLVEDASYDIIYVEDWGDGGFTF